MSCEKFNWFSGIYDYAGRSRNVFRRNSDVCRNLSAVKKDTFWKRLLYRCGGWRWICSRFRFRTGGIGNFAGGNNTCRIWARRRYLFRDGCGGFWIIWWKYKAVLFSGRKPDAGKRNLQECRRNGAVLWRTCRTVSINFYWRWAEWRRLCWMESTYLPFGWESTTCRGWPVCN